MITGKKAMTVGQVRQSLAYRIYVESPGLNYLGTP